MLRARELVERFAVPGKNIVPVGPVWDELERQSMAARHQIVQDLLVIIADPQEPLFKRGCACNLLQIHPLQSIADPSAVARTIRRVLLQEFVAQTRSDACPSEIVLKLYPLDFLKLVVLNIFVSTLTRFDVSNSRVLISQILELMRDATSHDASKIHFDFESKSLRTADLVHN